MHKSPAIQDQAHPNLHRFAGDDHPLSCSNRAAGPSKSRVSGSHWVYAPPFGNLQYQKNPRAHKNRIGTPPPPKPQIPPPLETRNFMGPEARTQKFQVPVKLAQPFPAPEWRTKLFADTRLFLTIGVVRTGGGGGDFGPRRKISASPNVFHRGPVL